MTTTYDADGNYAIGAAVHYRSNSGTLATGYVVERWDGLLDRRPYVRIADGARDEFDAGITRPESEVWAIDL